MVVHQNITNLAGYFHFLNVRKIPYVIHDVSRRCRERRKKFTDACSRQYDQKEGRKPCGSAPGGNAFAVSAAGLAAACARLRGIVGRGRALAMVTVQRLIW